VRTEQELSLAARSGL